MMFRTSRDSSVAKKSLATKPDNLSLSLRNPRIQTAVHEKEKKKLVKNRETVGWTCPFSICCSVALQYPFKMNSRVPMQSCERKLSRKFQDASAPRLCCAVSPACWSPGSTPNRLPAVYQTQHSSTGNTFSFSAICGNKLRETPARNGFPPCHCLR